MAATGVSGLDLYLRKNGKYIYLATAKPEEKSTTRKILQNIPSEKIEYFLYLPLYHNTDFLESREFDVPSINLGFSGSAQLQPEIVDLMAELKPALFVFDVAINMPGVERQKETLEPALRKLAGKNPGTPFLILDCSPCTNQSLNQECNKSFDLKNKLGLTLFHDKFMKYLG
jgi:hypothetical protein